MKKTLALILAMLLVFTACGSPAESAPVESVSAQSVVEAPASEEPPAEEAPVEEAPVEEAPVEEAPGPTVNLSDMTVVGEGVTAAGNTVMITAAGTYVLTGELSDGQLIVEAPDGEVILVLDYATIKNSIGPAVNIVAAEAVTINTVGESTLEDAETYPEGMIATAAVYADAPLTFGGEGTLNVISHSYDGIESTKGITFNSGVYNVVAGGGSPADLVEIEDETLPDTNALYSHGDLIFNGGTFKLDAFMDGFCCAGLMTIVDGVVAEISSGDDGIHSDDTIVISGGDLKVLRSIEGLEAMKINMDGGNVSITSVDDGVNAAGGEEDDMAPGFTAEELLTVTEETSNHFMSFTGGTIEVDAQGDGLDSNGATFVTGGTIIVHGPTGFDNGALDYTSSGRVEGGVVLAAGSNGMAQNFDIASSQVSVNVGLEETIPAGSTITLSDAQGNVLIEHTMNKEFGSVVVSCPEMKVGETYTLTTGDVVTEFEVTETIMSVGIGGMFGPPPMGEMPPMDGEFPPMPEGGEMPPMPEGGEMPPMGEMPAPMA